ncbi:MAG: hypothetical protein AAFY76_21125, partial [Cyanobacteria bacterium J06649_11]
MTSNVHLGLTMVNAVVSIGFHKLNLSNGIQPPVSIPTTTTSSNINAYNEPNDTDNEKDLALITSLDTLIDQIRSKLNKENVNEQEEGFKHAEDEEHCSNATKDGRNDLLCGYLMFLKCFKNVSHCALDLMKSSHLLPHFVSSSQVILIPCFSEEASEIHVDFTHDIKRIQNLVFHGQQSNQNLSTLPEDITYGFLSCFIKHLSALNEFGEYRSHLISIGTQFGINFDELDEAVNKLHKLLHSLNDNNSQISGSYVERLSNWFSVVFLFVTNIKRFPLVPVYPDKWNTASLFVMVLIEEGHPMVMLDPVSLCNHQESEHSSTTTSTSTDATSLKEKKFN